MTPLRPLAFRAGVAVALAVFRTRHRLRRRFRPGRYIDADPFSLRWIDPASIEDEVLPDRPERPPWGRVEAGRWDSEARPFEDRPVVRALTARFDGGRAWEETCLREHFVDQIDRFGEAWSHESGDGFERRCAAIDALYESMAGEGYLTQRTLARRGDGDAVPVLNEITVDVGRDGAFLWRGQGQHRLALSRLLGIEHVPVLVARRHRDWQAEREEARAGGGVGRTHPDLTDLVVD